MRTLKPRSVDTNNLVDFNHIEKLLIDFGHNPTADKRNNILNEISDSLDNTEAKINRLIVEGRLIELDLLEQAINQGRDMNEYKLLRLKELNNLSKGDGK